MLQIGNVLKSEGTTDYILHVGKSIFFNFDFLIFIKFFDI